MRQRAVSPPPVGSPSPRRWDAKEALQGGDLAASALAAVSLAMHCSHDLFTGHAGLPTAALSVGEAVLMGAAAPLAHLLSRGRPPGRKLWQPFQGGFVFVTMQGTGWALYSLWLMLTMIAVNATLADDGRSQAVAPWGMRSLLGCAGFAGTALLIASAWHFDPASPPLLLLGMRPVALVAVAVSLGSAALLVACDVSTVAEDRVDAAWFTGAAWFGVLGGVTACFFTHGVVGRAVHGSGYAWVQPFSGGARFAVLQFLGWSTLGIAIYLLLALSVTALPRGALCITAAGLLTAQMTLLHSLPSWEQGVGGISAAETLTQGAAAVPLLAGLLALLVTVAAEMLVLWPELLPLRPGPLALPSGAVLFAVPFITHYQSSRTYHSRGYRLFNPFGGSPNFVVMQTIGWSVYALALAAWCVHALNRFRWRGIVMPGTFAFVAECILLVSPHWLPAPGRRQPARTGSGALHGVHLLSTVLCFSGAGLFAAVDGVDALAVPVPRGREVALLFGAMALLAAPVADHLGGAALLSGYRIFQAFEGGPEFVGLQGVTWTVWSMQLVFHSVLLVNFEWVTVTAGRFFITLCGVLGILPWALQLLSMRYWVAPRESAAHGAATAARNLAAHLPTSPQLCDELAALAAQAQDPVLRAALDALSEEAAMRSGRISPPPGPLNGVGRDAAGATLLATACSVASIFFSILTEIFAAVLPPHLSAATALCFAVAVSGLTVAPVIVHLVAGPARFRTWKWWQPFRGGFNFLLLQVVGWALYGSALATSFVLVCSGLDTGGVRGMFIIVGIVGCGAHCTVLLSLSHFDDMPHLQDYADDSILQRHAEWWVSLLLTFGAVGLVLAGERLRVSLANVFSVTPLIVLAVLALVGALPLAHVAVRRSKHADRGRSGSADGVSPLHRSSSGGDEDWEASEAGGVSELVAWVAALLQGSVVAALVYQLLTRYVIGEQLHRFVAAAALLSLAAQGCFYLAVFYNEGCTLSESLHGAVYETACVVFTCALYSTPLLVYFVWASTLLWGTAGSRAFFAWMHIVTFCWQSTVLLTILRACCLVCAGSGLVAADWDLALWALGALWYMSTYTRSHRDGSRSRQGWRQAMWAWDALSTYFSLRVINDGGAEGARELQKLAAERALLFGWHPHGIYPWTCAWCILTRAWQRAVGVVPTSHAATVLFGAPLLRDIALNVGGLDVSAECLNGRLRKGHSALLVPGGQAEMRESRSWGPLHIVRRHKGFARLALRHGAALVPVFSFGDAELMDNIYMPSVQQWFLRKLGFGYPHFPYGRCYLPVPRRRPLTVIVGKPLIVERVENPTAEQVAELHARYYDALQDMYKRNAAAAGCARELVMAD
eukprot:TRINITY_DN70496_c0_g1_i1.p1 TRINITY_DN70496_c0_g1~~TRINITY_DN70496_c0_g1_i1.p1  ORF type:complete len:1348 (+),score=397.50 TRINITY_DN70496_c0_g1_i1:106-4149(+)